jgi:hypothetical protein
MACKLDTDLSFVNCTDLEVGGVSGAVYGIDFEDWRATNPTTDPDGTITAITLIGSGTKAVKYDLPYGAPIASTPFTQNNGGKSGWAHTLQMFLPTKDQSTKSELAGYANFSRMVWIVVLDASVTANVFGNDVGLRMSAYDELPNDPAKGGGIDVTFSTPTDATMENLPPVTFFNTDRATTIAALEALLTPVP